MNWTLDDFQYRIETLDEAGNWNVRTAMNELDSAKTLGFLIAEDHEFRIIDSKTGYIVCQANAREERIDMRLTKENMDKLLRLNRGFSVRGYCDSKEEKYEIDRIIFGGKLFIHKSGTDMRTGEIFDEVREATEAETRMFLRMHFNSLIHAEQIPEERNYETMTLL